MKDDVLWMGEIEAVVNEVDPIRGLIKVTLATNVQLDVGPEEARTTESLNPEKKEDTIMSGINSSPSSSSSPMSSSPSSIPTSM